MGVSFEGFPRTLDRSALKPGRWFVAADGLRPVLCLATDILHKDEPLAVTFTAPKVETLEVEAVPHGIFAPPFASVEDDVVFAPGVGEQKPTLVAPVRRTVRHGSLARLRSGDLGIAFAPPGGGVAVVSLTSGLRSDGHDLVFERWSMMLRRGAVETLVGSFKPTPRLADDRRRV